MAGTHATTENIHPLRASERLDVTLKWIGFHARHDARDPLLDGAGKIMEIPLSVCGELTGPAHALLLPKASSFPF